MGNVEGGDAIGSRVLMDVGVECGMISIRTQNEEGADNGKINDIATISSGMLWKHGDSNTFPEAQAMSYAACQMWQRLLTSDTA